jgi:lysophospholipid acyltransferase (LPLAT)-like uncharacterized protein
LDALRAAVPYLAYSYISFVGATSRVVWKGLEHVEAARAQGPFIYAFWHQRQILLTYTHRDKGTTVLVSRSKDGELIARTMTLSRIASVRGSSSRGAASATRSLLAALERGDVGITPDGPKGPAREVKPGVLFLAQASGRPILPIVSATSRGLFLKKAWDRFLVPGPFSRVVIHHAAPIWVRPEDSLEAKAAELKTSLDRITEEADRWARS